MRFLELSAVAVGGGKPIQNIRVLRRQTARFEIGSYGVLVPPTSGQDDPEVREDLRVSRREGAGSFHGGNRGREVAQGKKEQAEPAQVLDVLGRARTIAGRRGVQGGDLGLHGIVHAARLVVRHRLLPEIGG